MTWFILAFVATILWSLVNISDQYLVSKYSVGKRGSGGLVLFSSLVGIVVAILIGFLTAGIFQIPYADKLLLVMTGGLSIAWIVLYLFTLEIESISSVVPWFLTIPIFGYVLGYTFLDETLSIQQLVGSIIVLIGVLIISIDFSGYKKKFKWRPAIYMLMACFLYAICGVIFKYVTINNNYWVSTFWEYAGLGFFGILIFLLVPKFRNEFMYMNKKGGASIFALNSLSETLTIIGNLLVNYAILLAPVTLVYLVGSFQPAIVLFMTLIATKFFPNIAQENLTPKVIIPKIVAIIIMIIGSKFLI